MEERKRDRVLVGQSMETKIALQSLEVPEKRYVQDLRVIRTLATVCCRDESVRNEKTRRYYRASEDTTPQSSSSRDPLHL